MARWGAIVLMLSLVAPGGAEGKRHKNKETASSLSRPFTIQFMGMHTLSPTRHWPSVPFGSIRPAGTTWGTVEKTKGHFDWHGVDTWVAAAQKHHVELDYVFLNTPQWASTRPKERCNRGPIGCAAPPRDHEWEAFVTALVKRYRGRIASYEMWNEPNASGFFTGSAADMARMVAEAYPIIKAIDPEATVVGPSVSSTGWPTPYDTWLDQFLKAGGGKYVDAIAWHAYAGKSTQPALAPEDVADQIRRIRDVMKRHGVGDLPLWDTEGGWGSDSQLEDEQAQAAFLAKWYLIQFTHGVARAYWYQWDNPRWGTLWREDTGEAPAAHAYAQVFKWLDGATGSTPCRPAKRHVWRCTLLKGDKKYVIAWSEAGRAPFRIPKGVSTYFDLSGEKHPSTRQPVEVGISPILFQER